MYIYYIDAFICGVGPPKGGSCVHHTQENTNSRAITDKRTELLNVPLEAGTLENQWIAIIEGYGSRMLGARAHLYD